MTGIQSKRASGSITNEQWQSHRPLLKYFYQDQGLKLDAVRKIMEANYNFCATEQMFKKRLLKWGIRKNYTRVDKEEISIALLRYHAQGLTPPPGLLPSSPSQQRKIKRYMLEQGVDGTSIQADEVSPKYQNASLQQNAPTVTTPSDGAVCCSGRGLRLSLPLSLERIDWKQDSHTQAVEDVLLNARQYYARFFAREHIRASLNERPLVDAVFIRVQCARRLLAGGDNARGFLMLHLACENMSAMFTVQPFQLILEFFRTFTKPGWVKHPEARDAVLSHLSLTSRRDLGPYHPLSILTTLFMNTNTITESGHGVLSLLSAIIDEQYGNQDQASFIQLILAECYIALGLLDKAENICTRWLPDNEMVRMFPLSHHNVQKARKNLGCIRYKQGRLNEAQGIWLEVYDRDVAFYNGAILGDHAVVNCTHLASLYEGQGDYQKSAFFYKEAFEGALRTWGPVIVDLHEYFGSLQDALMRSDNVEELVKLQVDLVPLMHDWDRGQIAGLHGKEGLADSLLIYGNGSGQKICDFDAALHRHF